MKLVICDLPSFSCAAWVVVLATDDGNPWMVAGPVYTSRAEAEEYVRTEGERVLEGMGKNG